MDKKFLKEYETPTMEICSFDLSLNICQSSGGTDDYEDAEW